MYILGILLFSYSLLNAQGNKTICGVVYDVNFNPVEGALVYLISGDSTSIKTTLSNEDGIFNIYLEQSLDSTSFLKVTYFGLNTAIHSDLEQYMEIILSPIIFELDEANITASTTLYKADRRVHYVTEKQRQRATTTKELISLLPGITFNRANDKISVNGKGDILYIVDGIKRNQDYAKLLAPERIAKIEVIKDPIGRFQTDGYDAVINIVLKRNYSGYDIYMQNVALINPAGTNGEDWLINEQPKLNFTFIKNKWDIYGNVGYADIQWNTPVNIERYYTDKLKLVSDESTSLSPNNYYLYNALSASVGVSYSINPNHTLLFESQFLNEDKSSDLLLTMNEYSVENELNRKIEQETYSSNNVKNFIGSLSYKGKISDKIEVQADFTYNFIHDNNINIYTESDVDISNGISIMQKDYTKLFVGLNYNITKTLNFNINYSSIWRSYKIVDSYNSHEFRNQLFTNIGWSISNELQLNIGSGIEFVNGKQNYIKPLPFIKLNYKPFEWFNINSSYVTRYTYPLLYQLSPTLVQQDAMMYYIGNVNLVPELHHEAAVEFAFLDAIYLVPNFSYVNNAIMPYYYANGDKYYNSQLNATTMRASIVAGFQWYIGEFALASQVDLYKSITKNPEFNNAIFGWNLQAGVEYYNPRIKLGAALDYYREMEQVPMLQGYEMSGQDSWQLSVNKKFWKERIQMSLTYVLPIKWGVRSDLTKSITTPFYNEIHNLSLHQYDNMIRFTFAIRFGGGDKSRPKLPKTSIEGESKKGRGLMFE